MTIKNFNVKTGITVGNVTIDQNTGNVNASNVISTGLVSAASLFVSGSLKSNLNPYVSGVLSLGNVTNQYKDIYLSGNLSVGNQVISANGSNVVIANIETDNIYASNISTDTFTANTANIDSLSINNQFAINSTIDSTSTITGSFVTAGGVGIQKDLYVGGAVNLGNNAGGTTGKSAIHFNDGANSIDFDFK
jgi:hypothetical protein